jgi:GntR family transcriptional regulator
MTPNADSPQNTTIELVAGRQLAYQRIATDLKDALRNGAYPHGCRLPTEVELAERYQVSRQTVRRAMQDLIGEGLVLRTRGRGTISSSTHTRGQYLRSIGSIEDFAALSLDTVLEVVRPFERSIAPDAAGRLQLPTDEVVSGLFVRRHEGIPFCAAQVFVSVSLGRKVIELGLLPPPGTAVTRTIFDIVDEVSPETIMGAHQSITVAAIPTDRAELVECEPGQPVLRIDRLYFGSSGTPLELAISYFNPSRYSYRLELRRNSESHPR